MFKNIFKNKKVIVTGHTGFKGSWLTLWLIKLKSKVVGISNGIITEPSHYKLLGLNKKIKNYKLDLINFDNLKKIINKERPDFIFHLAGQSLVKKSFIMPKFTFDTNTIGTLNILESLKGLKKKCVVIIITSDKVYKNLELKKGYRENDLLGGTDPYSASKAAAELVIQSYVKSFFLKKNNKIFIATARAGNVIGGGDWSQDRLIPDCVKSWSKKKTVTIRSPHSTRPWQHVLEAINGYLTLAERIFLNKRLHGEAFNFGPKKKNDFDVITIIKTMKRSWSDIKWIKSKINNKNQKESKLLKLNSIKAKKLLNWECKLSFNETIHLVTNWYKEFYTNKEIISLKQLKIYEKKIKEK